MRDVGNVKMLRANISRRQHLANRAFAFNANDWPTNTIGYDIVLVSNRKNFTWVSLWLAAGTETV